MRPARTFTDFIHAQVEKSDPHRININKFRSREIAAAAGVATPQLYAVYKTPKEIDFAALPDCCVSNPAIVAPRGAFTCYSAWTMAFTSFLAGLV